VRGAHINKVIHRKRESTIKHFEIKDLALVSPVHINKLAQVPPYTSPAPIGLVPAP
jgi:hypothetical protein